MSAWTLEPSKLFEQYRDSLPLPSRIGRSAVTNAIVVFIDELDRCCSVLFCGAIAETANQSHSLLTMSSTFSRLTAPSWLTLLKPFMATALMPLRIFAVSSTLTLDCLLLIVSGSSTGTCWQRASIPGFFDQFQNPHRANGFTKNALNALVEFLSERRFSL